MSTAVATKSIDTLKSLLEKAKPSIQSLLPSHMTADKVIKTALLCATKTPKLQECTPLSVLQAVASAAELGLEAGSPLGHAYLVPFRNKRGIMECQLIVGYRGYIELARRSGEILSIEARVVHEKDTFRVAFGTERPIEHEPFLRGDPGPVYCAYAVAQVRDSWPQAEVMALADLNKIRARSKAKDDGPWVTDTEEMYRKTVVRRLQKYLPLSSEMAKAMAVDREAVDIDDDAVEANFEILMDPQPIGSNGAEKAEVANQTTTEPAAQATGSTGPAGEVDPAASSQAKGELTTRLCAARDANDMEALKALASEIAKQAHLLTTNDLKTLQSTHEMCVTVVNKRKK